MVLPVWPQINNLAELGSWSFTGSDGKGRAGTDMDNGATRARRRFTARIARTSFKVLLSDFESLLFDYFYTNVLRDGTLWFVMPILGADGVVYTSHMVRFPIDYTPNVSGAGYKLNSLDITLEVRNIVTLSSAAYYLFSTFPPSSVLKLSNALDTFINDQYPEDQG